jgi:hypothetical protein
MTRMGKMAEDRALLRTELGPRLGVNRAGELRRATEEFFQIHLRLLVPEFCETT